MSKRSHLIQCWVTSSSILLSSSRSDDTYTSAASATASISSSTSGACSGLHVRVYILGGGGGEGRVCFRGHFNERGARVGSEQQVSSERERKQDANNACEVGCKERRTYTRTDMMCVRLCVYVCVSGGRGEGPLQTHSAPKKQGKSKTHTHTHTRTSRGEARDSGACRGRWADLGRPPAAPARTAQTLTPAHSVRWGKRKGGKREQIFESEMSD